MLYKSKSEERARDYAKRYGFRLKRIPYSSAYPNGYIQITTPIGVQFEVSDMDSALREMRKYPNSLKFI